MPIFIDLQLNSLLLFFLRDCWHNIRKEVENLSFEISHIEINH